MGAKTLGTIFNYYDILATSRDDLTNSLSCQLGNIGSKRVYQDGASIWGPIGLSSTPSNPTDIDACQSISINDSGTEQIIATRDVRGQSIYGGLNPGETCLYAVGADGNSQGRVLIKGDGSISAITTSDNTKTGQTNIMRHAPDGFTLVNQFGSISLNENGFQVLLSDGSAAFILQPTTGAVILTGKYLQLIGGIVQIGSAPTVPAAYGPGGTATVGSTSVFISP